MVRSKRHGQLQRKLAGRKGKIEVPIRGGRRIDVQKGRKVSEIERSGDPERIRQAIRRLHAKKTFKKELLVRDADLDKAKEIAQKEKGKLTIQNLSKTRRRFVR